jgi:hypothetical protein
MTNIRCKGGKEIDLLAINPKSLEKYHVEARVSTSHSFALRAKDHSTRSSSYRRGLNYFIKEKFNHPLVVKTIKEFFGSGNYSKILVVFHVDRRRFDAWDADEIGVKIWLITDIIETLMMRQKSMGSRDQIMRTLELMHVKRIYDSEIEKQEKIEKGKFLRIVCKTCRHLNKIRVITKTHVWYTPEPLTHILLPVYEATITSKCEKCGDMIAESSHRFILNQQVPIEWVEKYAKETKCNVLKLRLIESNEQSKDIESGHAEFDFESERAEFWSKHLYDYPTEKLAHTANRSIIKRISKSQKVMKGKGKRGNELQN